MANQMTPDELRETAKRLRAAVSVMERLGETADDERAGADALDRLADVIEHAERTAGSNRADSPYVFERASHQSALRILAITRGHATNENRSE